MPLNRICTNARMIVLLICIFLAFLPASAANVEPKNPFRQAILVGVWRYAPDAAPPLEPMEADLIQLEKTFNSVLFDKIVPLPNPTKDEFEREIDEAAQRADTEGKSRATLTVVYFAGHGAMVGHDSFLLASNYVPPVFAQEIVLQGGINTAYVGNKFSQIGQPSILIVEACRNAYIPSASARMVDNGEPLSEDDTDPEMIAQPGPINGYGVFFAQKPGQPVKLPLRTLGQPSLLTSSIDKYLRDYPSASTFFSIIGKELTDKNPYPVEPGYDSKLSGNLMLHYDFPAMEQDRIEWEKSKAKGRDFIAMFLILFRTSRYIPVARDWLKTDIENADEPVYAVYSRKIQKYLGDTPRSWFSRPVKEQMSSLATLGTGSERILVKDIALIQRSRESEVATFEGRTIDNRMFQFEGVAIAADPSTVPQYWSSDAETINCDTQVIDSGACPQVIRLVEQARQDPAQLGTIYVAGVFNIALKPEAAELTFRRLHAVSEQLEKNGIPTGRVRFRSFFESDLPKSALGSLLVKRGDGKQFKLE